jgi:cysteine-rich repeat protein
MAQHTAGLAIVLGLLCATTGAARADVDSGIAAIQRSSAAPLTVRRDAATGLATFVAAPAGRTIALAAPRGAKAGDRALTFIDLGGAAFGLRSRQDVVLQKTSGPDEVGIEHVRFQQVHDGVPVRGAELIVHLRGAGVTAVNGRTIAPSAVGTKPTIAAVAATAAASTLLSEELGVLNADLSPPHLELLNRGLLEARASATHLAWFIEARGFGLRQFIWVDAHDATILLHVSQITDAKVRAVYDANDTSSLPGTLVRSEGGPATGDTDADAAYDYSGDTYDYFSTQHGRDSYNNAGAALISTVHYCEGGCPYANAFWDGVQMVYGEGFSAADDVAAHELSHAVTEYAAGLVYCLQSGALNESFSDIFGETVDLTNTGGSDGPGDRWYMGEDVPGFGAIRNLSDPTIFGSPGKVSDPQYLCFSTCFDPDNGGVHYNSGVPNHAYALMVDGGTYNGFTVTGIGLTKAGKIQYRALDTYLTPLALLGDAYNALLQSCLDLIGTAGITAGDCVEVGEALDAVEMGEPVCLPVCGDGNTFPPEQCDDGGVIDGDGCDSNCTLTACGNGIPTAGESCDDGNGTNGDGCDSNCTLTACGNGIATGGEACDDGNPTAGDGCEPDCTLSPGCQFHPATDLPQPINDVSLATSTLAVSQPRLVTSVRILGLRGTHTYTGDLVFSLQGPNNVSALLIQNMCGSNNNFDLDLADDASLPLSCPLTDGLTHQPLTPLAALAGQPATGDWQLHINDVIGGDFGTFLDWGLLICTDGADDACPSAPDPTCGTAQKSLLLLKDGPGSKDKLLWKWIKGEATVPPLLDDPLGSAAYRLCLYSGAGDDPLGGVVVPSSPTLWKQTGTGYKYKDKAGAEDGVSLVIAKAGDAGKSKGVLKAGGANLPMPALGSLALPVTAQLHNVETGLCWGSAFSGAQVTANDAAQFKGKTP